MSTLWAVKIIENKLKLTDRHTYRSFYNVTDFNEW